MSSIIYDKLSEYQRYQLVNICESLAKKYNADAARVIINAEIKEILGINDCICVTDNAVNEYVSSVSQVHNIGISAEDAKEADTMLDVSNASLDTFESVAVVSDAAKTNQRVMNNPLYTSQAQPVSADNKTPQRSNAHDRKTVK